MCFVCVFCLCVFVFRVVLNMFGVVGVLFCVCLVVCRVPLFFDVPRFSFVVRVRVLVF